jgi:hypothetical protein
MTISDKVQNARLKEEVRELKEALDFYESPLHDHDEEDCEPVGIGESAIIIAFLISIACICIGACAYIPRAYATNIVISGICGFTLTCFFFFCANVERWTR